MKTTVTFQQISYLLMTLLIISLIPLCVIALYNYPAADDFSMGAAAHLAYVHTGSLLSAIGQGFYMAWYDYLNWMGYFSSTFFLSLPPCIIDERMYPLGAFFLIGILVLSVYFFMDTLLVRRLGVGRGVTGCISALTCIIMIQCLPGGLTRVEAFYWYCSGANYVLMFSLGLFWISMLLGFRLKERHMILRTVCASLLGFIVGGGNYMTALSCAMIAVLVILWSLAGGVIIRFINNRNLIHMADGTGISWKAPTRMICFPCLFMLAGFALSCLAPGNAVRGSAVSGYGAVKTVLIALHYVLSICISEWTSWSVLVLLLMLAPFLWVASRRVKLSFRFPVTVTVMAWGFTAANIAPPLYALGNIEAGRIRALFWMQYVLLLVLTEGYLLGWLRNRVLQISDKSGDEDTVSQHTLCALGIMLVFLLFGSAMEVKAEPHHFTATSAMTDLLNGSAGHYASQNAERRRILTDPGVTEVVFDAHKQKPELLFFSDITKDPMYWSNAAMARYYRKKIVRIR